MCYVCPPAFRPDCAKPGLSHHLSRHTRCLCILVQFVGILVVKQHSRKSLDSILLTDYKISWKCIDFLPFYFILLKSFPVHLGSQFRFSLSLDEVYIFPYKTWYRSVLWPVELFLCLQRAVYFSRGQRETLVSQENMGCDQLTVSWIHVCWSVEWLANPKEKCSK